MALRGHRDRGGDLRGDLRATLRAGDGPEGAVGRFLRAGGWRYRSGFDGALAPLQRRFTVLNVGGGGQVTVAELTEICGRAAGDLGLGAPEITCVPDTAGRGPDFGLDVARARELLGWESWHQLEEGMRELVAAAQEG